MSGRSFLAVTLVVFLAMAEAQHYGSYTPKQTCKPEISYVTTTERVPKYFTKTTYQVRNHYKTQHHTYHTEYVPTTKVVPKYITNTETVSKYVTKAVPHYVTKTENEQHTVYVTQTCNYGYSGYRPRPQQYFGTPKVEGDTPVIPQPPKGGNGGGGADGSNGGSEYHYSWLHDGNRKYTHGGAVGYCNGLGGGWGPVSIEDGGESSFINGVIGGHHKEYIWTGGVRDGSGWVWPSGAAFSNLNWSHTGAKRIPQPDNNEGNESCLAILNNFYQDGIKWHDVGCSHEKPIICERRA